MSALRDHDCADIQRIVLTGPGSDFARHMVLTFCSEATAPSFLSAVIEAGTHSPGNVTVAMRKSKAPLLQRNIGITFRGLEWLQMPRQFLQVLRAKSPAFAAGAPVRAATHLGDTGISSATGWDKAFEQEVAHAVVSLHSSDKVLLDDEVVRIEALGRRFGVKCRPLPLAKKLAAPVGEQLVHFGLRDGLSRVAIRGWSDLEKAQAPADVTRHEPGEFLLGHAQDCGANPWALTMLPWRVREFFRNGSFAVLRQMEQDEEAFRKFVFDSACAISEYQSEAMINLPDYVVAKLTGRWPDGRRLDVEFGPTKSDASRPFGYASDPTGLACPLGAHARRMNPRSADVAHQKRSRPLLRRGLPYGSAYSKETKKERRGLLGLFFCASIEEQFEHLLGQWADRVPVGSPDAGNAKDPLIGLHEEDSGQFVIPLPEGKSLRLDGLRPFVRTRGTVYMFYPSLSALNTLISADWIDDDEACE